MDEKLHRVGASQLLKVLRELKAGLEWEPRIRLAFLYGSVLRRPLRDIDLVIYAAPTFSFEEAMGLYTKLQKRIELQLDLVQLQEMPPSLRLRVLLHGFPVVLKDRLLFHRLVAASVSELEDAKLKLELTRRCQSSQDSRRLMS